VWRRIPIAKIATAVLLGLALLAAADLGFTALAVILSTVNPRIGLIGDAGAVCAVIDRAGLSTTRLPVRVELAGAYSRGRTIVDRRDWSGDIAHDPHGASPTSVQVALSVDAGRYADLWLRTVSCPPPLTVGMR